MAARWQQWMPFHIDRFRGSPHVQAMHPAARMGYLYLLAAAWQSEDCSLSSDPLDLAAASGLGDELWAQYGTRILTKFRRDEHGKLKNFVLFEEWQEAKRIFEARVSAAKSTNASRSPHADRTVTDGIAARSADTITGTYTETNTRTNTKTSRGKREVSKETLEIYSAYPRKVGKSAALSKIEHALKSLASETPARDAKWLLDRVKEFARSETGRGQFCPHPATWFHQGRYNDDPAEWNRNGHKPTVNNSNRFKQVALA